VLGRALVERYHDKATAEAEDEWFIKVFSQRSVPDHIETVTVHDANATVMDILRLCLPDESSSELRRLITYGGVRVNGVTKLEDPDQRHAIASGTAVRVGKRRWFRVLFPHS
jgi:tyrosyl-tRNA synthetase